MSLFNNRYKANTICQISPMMEDGAQFALIKTPIESIVLFVSKGQLIEKCIYIAAHELNEFLNGKVSEHEFIEALQERETIEMGIMESRNIPIEGDLYDSLFEYFGSAENIKTSA